MEHFTPLAALVGGTFIGLSAVALMLLTGRVAGVSGITAGLLSLRPSPGEFGWRAAFILGLVLAAPLLRLAGFSVGPIQFVAPVGVMIVAGLLVGYGTVLGNGCTSGHGVCGIARFSYRSIVATLVFMACALLTVLVVRHGGVFQ